jgi:hypothetical protein
MVIRALHDELAVVNRRALIELYRYVCESNAFPNISSSLSIKLPLGSLSTSCIM